MLDQCMEERNHYDVNLNFECTFSMKQNLNRHITAIHTEKKPFECETCDYSSSPKLQLNRQIRSTHEENLS